MRSQNPVPEKMHAGHSASTRQLLTDAAVIVPPSVSIQMSLVISPFASRPPVSRIVCFASQTAMA